MSAFQTYVLILIIIYIVYYIIIIGWEISHPHSKPVHFEYDPEAAFGFKKVYVRELSDIDGSFFITEDNNQDSLDEELDDGDVPPECIDDGGCDDDLPVDDDYSHVDNDSEEEVQTEDFYEEEYNSEEFALIMSRPLKSPVKITREIILPDEMIPERQEEELSEFDLSERIEYCRVDFRFSPIYSHIQILLEINKHTYVSNMDADDVRKFIQVSDNGFISSDIDCWWRRKYLAVKYFKEDIIYEYDMVIPYKLYGYEKEIYNTPIDITAKEIKVPELWFTLQECQVIRTQYDEYRIFASIKGGPILYAKLTEDDVNIYLQRDENGKFLKEISPEQLMVKYLLRDIVKEIPKFNENIRIVNDFNLNTEPPCFCYDKDFMVTEQIKKEAFTNDTQIICVEDTWHRRKFYLDSYIYGIRRTVEMSLPFVFETVLEFDESFVWTNKISPVDLAVSFFGHEFQYLKNGNIPEPESSIVYDWNYSVRKSSILPEEFTRYDYPETDVFKTLKIKKNNVSVHRDISKYYIFLVIGGKYYTFVLSKDDVCNYLERDEHGRFTRRVSVENLVGKYAEKYAAMVKMYKDGIPKKLISMVFDETKYSVDKLLKSLQVKKPHTHTSEYSSKKKKLIKEEFSAGVSLTELRKKYKMREYATLYRILGNAAVGENYKIPDEYQKYENN